MANIDFATIYSSVRPTEEQHERLLSFLQKRFGINELRFSADESIKDGFKLDIGDKIYDWTRSGRLHQLFNQLDALDPLKPVVPLIKETISAFKPSAEYTETGTVDRMSDGIAFIKGLDSAEYGEILIFESGAKGLVQDLKQDEIGCILFDDGENVSQGDRVYRTEGVAGMPVGDDFIGRVIDSLGNPIDGLGEIKNEEYLPIERHAPGIIDRQPVNVPLETGILAIDSMFPIGRGQRELIIGDRQTGKTTIAVDTIINQAGKNVICIYVAIGQKSATVASLVNTLKTRGAMDYTIIINSPAADPAPLQYIAPYSGCTLGEYFMNKGKDVLIIYDDLSKHAVAYRTISLLLGRTPGREAYPGDIFYLHSRLLERAAHLSDEKGGGSLTALPVVETQAGDVSAYIPTNVISITDGQIFLETDLFFSGQRPAINVGISVSRVGGDAQSKAMKKAGGTLRLDLAQYNEMKDFTQFSGELDEDTRSKLNYGETLMNMLKQRQHSPMPRHRQVIALTAALNGKIKATNQAEISAFLGKVFEYAEINHKDICDMINQKGIIGDSEKETIFEICDSVRSDYGIIERD